MSRILVVYYQLFNNDRNTINEHLYAFERYSGADVWHYNAAVGLPFGLTDVKFDLVIFHYSFLIVRWNGRGPFKRLMRKVQPLAKINAPKAAFPQDEYLHSDIMCEFFKEFGIDYVFTNYDPEDWARAYPIEKAGHSKFFKTFTGYVENHAIEATAQLWKPHSERKYDLGYRARKLPHWLGHHGTLKWRLTEEFLRAGAGRCLQSNLSNDPKDVFLGQDWYHFLADCRVVLGCEGGSTLLDADGSIRSRVDAFNARFPNADFATVERECFPDQDDSLALKTLSPRHFEAAMTRTCQALVVGRYEGVFQPDTHYIPIHSDFSNVEEVIKKIQDKAYCEAMAQRTYDQVVSKGRFTYRDFVQDVLNTVNLDTKVKTPQDSVFFARAMLKVSNLLVPLARQRYLMKAMGFRLLECFGLVRTYRLARKRLLAWED